MPAARAGRGSSSSRAINAGRGAAPALVLALAAGLALAGGLAAIGTPAAGASQSPQPVVAHAPDKAEHTEFVVETNRKGQVTRVRSGHPSADLAFNAMTYGNALQAFIRTPDGSAIAGTYRLTYDYDPKTKLVRRGVGLVRSGGVDPNALGAVDKMAALDRKAHSGKKTGTLPSLNTITGQKTK